MYIAASTRGKARVLEQNVWLLARIWQTSNSHTQHCSWGSSHFCCGDRRDPAASVGATLPGISRLARALPSE